MDSLNVLRPHYVTRVSEYIPEIIAYIQRIIANGFAYESHGSVYFDTTAFVDAGHDYGKLEPTSVGNEALIAEGEGTLTAADDAIKQQKKAAGDFALWKKSKPAEPSWQSPWGLGRPGWHIECSAMASTVLGPVIDIHVGGEDLRFPHHSNEVAQAEAYHDSHQWVNYFLHSGHLHIEGLKMSKSLKNFITIENWLKRYNARQIRLAFLGHRYNAPMNYTDHGMEEAINLDRSFIDFFGTLKATLRDIAKCDIKTRELRPHQLETELFAELGRCQKAVHQYLADNFDTPGALREIQNLIRSTNAYLASQGVKANELALESIGRYVTKMFKVFGLVTGGGDIGYGEDASAGGQSREKVLSPVLDAFCDFRDKIRQTARGENYEAISKILSLCDAVRDEVLPHLGVRLEDRGLEQPSVWKLEEAASLVMEIQRKKEAEEKRREAKAKQKAAREAKLRQELEKGKVSPDNMFREGDYAGKYSEYDDSGMPTKDVDGNVLAKSALKGLAKARLRQQKLHDKYLASTANKAENGNLVTPAKAV
ncbi:Cysteine--tRNA ligase [Gracilaria domingensis]|nr:Cysteine--tRNA ligase [Gracilaria domingensis]